MPVRNVLRSSQWDGIACIFSAIMCKGLSWIVSEFSLYMHPAVAAAFLPDSPIPLASLTPCLQEEVSFSIGVLCCSLLDRAWPIEPWMPIVSVQMLMCTSSCLIRSEFQPPCRT